MSKFALPVIKAISDFDTKTQTVDVTFTLPDPTGSAFDYTRSVNAVTDYSGNYDELQTLQRACQILAGEMGKVLCGILSKKSVDIAASAQAALQKAAEEAQAAALKSTTDAQTATATTANATTTQSTSTVSAA